MDLSVSPDIEAYFCYAIVFVLGAVTAVIQINRGLGNLGGVWLIPRTWLLFCMYLMVPIILFWFLDRTGAITDTSVFAAVLVGVGYAGIMNGTNQTISSAASLSQFWTPFQNYANEVQKSVLQRTKRNEDRLMDGLVSSVIAQRDRYEPLERLAMVFSPNAAALRTNLAAIDPPAPPANAAAAAAAAPDPAEATDAAADPAAAAARAATATALAAARQKEILEDKTRLLFTELVKVPDAFYLMRSRNIISKQVYWLDVKGLRLLSQYLMVLVPLVIGLAVIAPRLGPAFTNLPSNYYVWRLIKTNATSIEQNRARFNLLTLMNGSDAARDAATGNIARVLRQPGLPVERIDLLLQSLLESRNVAGGNAGLPTQLVASLRSPSVDARSRINDVLKHLADTGCTTKYVEEKDKTWKPGDGDATVSLELHIRSWADFWNKTCQKPAAAAT